MWPQEFGWMMCPNKASSRALERRQTGDVTTIIRVDGMFDRSVTSSIGLVAGWRCDHKNLSGWQAQKKRDPEHWVGYRLEMWPQEFERVAGSKEAWSRALGWLQAGDVTTRIWEGGRIKRSVIPSIGLVAGWRCDHKNLSGWQAQNKRDREHWVGCRLEMWPQEFEWVAGSKEAWSRALGWLQAGDVITRIWVGGMLDRSVN